MKETASELQGRMIEPPDYPCQQACFFCEQRLCRGPTFVAKCYDGCQEIIVETMDGRFLHDWCYNEWLESPAGAGEQLAYKALV